MQLTLSDLLELIGIGLLLVAAGLWDLRALLAGVGVVLVMVGYLLAAPDGELE